MRRPLSSIAIAGAWGYIGRKFLDAAAQLELAATLFDPGTPPEDLAWEQINVLQDAEEFYRQSADLFHLALHPEHRALGWHRLLQRSTSEPIRILCEKPMAAPEHAAQCAAIVRELAELPALVLYDFPELYDPITQRMLDYLVRFERVEFESIRMQRSKDREDPTIGRNFKRMVHIQYQESVHCLAFVLYLLARVKGSIESVFQDGCEVTARSQPYQPPNPSAYPSLVDGKCEYQLRLGQTEVCGLTDFKRHASWSKRREIRGKADGRPFVIVADYLEGKKLLMINGQPCEDVMHTNSYVEVIRSIGRMCQQSSVADLMQGIYPNPSFARVTYQLSSVLWHSSWRQQPARLASLGDLLRFDAGFAEAQQQFARYQ